MTRRRARTSPTRPSGSSRATSSTRTSSRPPRRRCSSSRESRTSRSRRRCSSRRPSSPAPSFWTRLVQRLTQGPETAGLRGNGIAGVTVLPGGQELSASRTTRSRSRTTSPSRSLVENSGESQETQVDGDASIIRQQPQHLARSRPSTSSTSGETKTVRFTRLRRDSPSRPRRRCSVTRRAGPGRARTRTTTPRRVPDHLHARLGGRPPRGRLGPDVGPLRRRSLDRHRRRSGGGRGSPSLARLLSEAARRAEGPARPHRARARTISSTSPSRCRRGSTTSTASSTRSRPGSRASTGGSTAACPTPRSSATTPTRTRAGTSRRRSPSSTARAPASS